MSKKEKRKKEKLKTANADKEEIKKEKTEIKEISLEELTESPEPQEQPQEIEDAFSELMLSPAGEMPVPTLILSDALQSTQPAEPIETAAENAPSFRTDNTTNLYTEKVYQGEYAGGGYSVSDYESREQEMRELIRRERIAKQQINTQAPIVRDMMNVESLRGEDNWEAPREKETRDYTVEKLVKKEAKKRKMID